MTKSFWTSLATGYVAIWMAVTTALGALALVRWSLQVLGWLP